MNLLPTTGLIKYLFQNRNSVARYFSTAFISQLTSKTVYLPPVKILVLFLASLILYLTVAPCCPQDNCADEATPAHAAEPESDTPETEPCSPFYSCAGCTGFVLFSFWLETRPAVLVPTPPYTDYQISSSVAPLPTIWQPPKLS
jgi:hypothetical protein